MIGAVRIAATARPLVGESVVPGDKSLGHRALLLGALAAGTTTVHGFPGGADVRATLGAIRALGADVTWEGDTVTVEGRDLGLGDGVDTAIDCGNSGTTMRLASGLVAGVRGRRVLDGDASLRRRPMERVAVPLRAMGARIATSDGRAPITIDGTPLRGLVWTMAVASAQVKSAVLLAGLRASGMTTVVEPQPTRDHTERMLRHMGIAVDTDGGAIRLTGGRSLRPITIRLAGDPSSAAFLVVAALLVPGSRIRIAGVGMNPLRTGALDILRRMGARITVDGMRDEAGEPCGDLVVEHGELRGTTIGPEEVPGAIDELPILAIAAAFAEGETCVTGAEELRVKESDRIAAMEQLRGLGVAFEARPDGFVVRGRPDTRLAPGRIITHGDHRIAMALAVAGLRSPDGITIDDAGCADVSFPGFFDGLKAFGASVESVPPR
jgi:3-phosphoshikimate 1-carboxyvinyltransferase